MSKHFEVDIHDIIRCMYIGKDSLPLNDIRKYIGKVIGEDSVKKVESDFVHYLSYRHCLEMARVTPDVEGWELDDIAETVERYASRYGKGKPENETVRHPVVKPEKVSKMAVPTDLVYEVGPTDEYIQQLERDRDLYHDLWIDEKRKIMEIGRILQK